MDEESVWDVGADPRLREEAASIQKGLKMLVHGADVPVAKMFGLDLSK